MLFLLKNCQQISQIDYSATQVSVMDAFAGIHFDQRMDSRLGEIDIIKKTYLNVNVCSCGTVREHPYALRCGHNLNLL